MSAVFLPHLRPTVLDRTRAMLDALGPSATVVSPHRAPATGPAGWVRLPDADPATWSAWVRERRPGLVVVDGSGPHALAVVGTGPTVAVVAQIEGEVDGHTGAAYSEADLVLAPWAPGSAATWPARWQEHTLHLGAVGWQAASSAGRRTGVPAGPTRRHCVVLSATGAGPGPRERRRMIAGTAGWYWTYAPEHAVLEEGPVWDALHRCSVVVCAPTPANLAAVAAVRKPAVLLPGSGSPGQAFLAAAARRSAPVRVSEPWPDPDEWRVLLDDVRALDGDAWETWSPAPGLVTLARLAGDVVPAAAPAVGGGAAPATVQA